MAEKVYIWDFKESVNKEDILTTQANIDPGDTQLQQPAPAPAPTPVTWFDIAQKQYQAWALSKEQKDQLAGLVTSKIDTWMTRDEAIKATQEQLKWAKVPEWKPKPIETQPIDTLTWAPVGEPAVVPKVETPKVEEVKWAPITDAQTIKSNQLANQETERQMKEQKDAKAKQDFSNALNAGANLEDLAKIVNDNPSLKQDFNNQVKLFYKNKANAQFVNKYAWLSKEQLYTEYENWNIVIWSQQYNLLPAETKNRLEEFKKLQDAINTWDTKKQEERFIIDNEKILSLNDIVSELKELFTSDLRAKSEEILNNPNIVSKRQEIEDKQWEINNIDKSIKDTEKRIRKEFAWSPESFIQAMLWDELDGLYNTREYLINDYNSKLSTYQSLKEDAQNELELYKYEDAQNKQIYQTALWLYEQRRQEVVKMQETLRLEMRADEKEAKMLEYQQAMQDFEEESKIMAEQRALQSQKELMEFQYKLKAWEISGKWLERQDWLYFVEDNGKATLVVNWWLNTTSDGWLQIISRDANWDYYMEYKDALWNTIWANMNNTTLDNANAINLLNAPDWTLIPSRLSETTNVAWGKECWEYVNDIVSGIVWEKIWSYYQDKLNYASDVTWWVWDVVVWQPKPQDPEWSKWGHTWVIVGESGDNWIVKSSNLEWKWLISTVTVPKNVIDWYRQTGLIPKKYNKIWDFNSWEVSLFNSDKYNPQTDKDDARVKRFYQFKEVQKKIRSDLWSSLSDIMDSSQGQKDLTSSDNSTYKDINLVVGQLANLNTAINEYRDEATGFFSKDEFSPLAWIISSSNPYNTKAQEIKARLQALVPKVARWIFWEVWVLTDTDIQNYMQTLPNIKQTAEVQDVVQYALLSTLSRAIESNIRVDAWTYDVSWLSWIYKQIQNDISDLEWNIVDKNDTWDVYIHTDSDWVKRTMPALKAEMVRQIQNWEATAEQWRIYLDNNNLTIY